MTTSDGAGACTTGSSPEGAPLADARTSTSRPKHAPIPSLSAFVETLVNNEAGWTVLLRQAHRADPTERTP